MPNLTDINTTSFTSFIQSLNQNSSGWLGNTIPFIIFTISLLWFLTSEYKPRDSFLFATIASFITSLLLRAINMVSDAVLILFLLAGVVAIFVTIKQS